MPPRRRPTLHPLAGPLRSAQAWRDQDPVDVQVPEPPIEMRVCHYKTRLRVGAALAAGPVRDFGNGVGTPALAADAKR